MVGNPSDAEDLMQGSLPSALSEDWNFPWRVGIFYLASQDDGQCGLDASAQEDAPLPLPWKKRPEPDEETGGPRKDIGAPDLRLSGAVDRVNLETLD